MYAISLTDIRLNTTVIVAAMVTYPNTLHNETLITVHVPKRVYFRKLL